MTKINHLSRCAFNFLWGALEYFQSSLQIQSRPGELARKLEAFVLHRLVSTNRLGPQLIRKGGLIAVCIGMAALAQECQACQETLRSPLKQARDPYYNPKLQTDANLALQGAEKRVVNPLFAPKRDVGQAVSPVEKSSSTNVDANGVQILPRWEPPIPKSAPSSQPANNSLPSSPLKSVPAQSEAGSLNPNSIIRNSGRAKPREIVGDFSADLSKLNRSRPLAASPGNSNLGGTNSGELKPESKNADLRLSNSKPTTTKASEPLIQSKDNSNFTPDNQIGGPKASAANDFKLNGSQSSAKDLSSTLSPVAPIGKNPLDKIATASPLPQKEGSLEDRSAEFPTSKSSTISSANSFLEPTRLLAMVGNEPVFVGDMLFELNQMIEQHMTGAPEAFKDRERQKGIGMLLNKYIDSKLLYIDTLRKLPEGADVDKIIEQAAKEFDKTAAPTMMKAAGVSSLADFDVYLRMQGTSLRKLRLHWSKDQLTRYFMSQELEFEKEVSHRELLEVYQKNLDSYAIPAKARWEQITVRFDRTASREEAEKQLVEMGNKIVYGANFASVAKKGSHGFTAGKGGLHDWIGKNELVSKELDEAIFSEDIGKLSDKIETAEGLHIIRVLERTEASQTAFVEAQVKIKEDLLNKRRASAFEKHLTQLRQEIPVVRYDQEETDSVRVADTKQQSLNR